MTNPTVYKGLNGVPVDYTAVSKVVPETNSLTYRGYAVQDLTEHCAFEEVVYLLWYGELPTPQQRKEFEAKERSYRSIPQDLIDIIKALPQDAHPMDVVRTAISYLGTTDTSPAQPTDTEANYDKALRILAATPTVVAWDQRRRRNQEFIEPNAELNYTENFLTSVFGQLPEPALVKAFNTSLILYAEHSFNASTFTTRVVASTLSDIYSAITAGVGALKGPLHGGANEAVMYDMIEIDTPEHAEEWILSKIAKKEKVMGFGHRVYRSGDSRVPTMKKALDQIASVKDGKKWVEIYEIMEKTMVDNKNIRPNVDFPTGPAYYMMGFDINQFTPIFVMSRISGWSAHIFEQWSDNSIIRPLSVYTGQEQRQLP